jgi:hypothetical protein
MLLSPIKVTIKSAHGIVITRAKAHDLELPSWDVLQEHFLQPSCYHLAPSSIWGAQPLLCTRFSFQILTPTSLGFTNQNPCAVGPPHDILTSTGTLTYLAGSLLDAEKLNFKF